MKLALGIISDEIGQDFEHALDVIKELGAEYVEIRSLWEKSVVDLSQEEIDKAKRLVDASGLKVAAIGSSLFKCPLREGSEATGGGYFTGGKGYVEHIATIDHCFELARIFGTQMVRTFAFWREGDLTDSVLDEIAERLLVPVQKAEQAGMALVLENEHQTFIGSGEESRRLLDRIPSKSFGLIWDPGNAYHTGEVPYPDGYERVKERTVHVHIKDADRDEAGEYHWMPVGKGEMDITGQLQALIDDRYTGIVSLETHYVPDGGTKEEGSRESWKGLIEILQSTQ